MTRLNDRSSDKVLCTSAMFSKPVRSLRNSFSYMCMTISLSSAWIAAMPPACASTFSTSQMSPKSTMRPLREGGDVGREHLDRGMPGLHCLGELTEALGRDFAEQHRVKGIVAIAGARPLPLPPFG